MPAELTQFTPVSAFLGGCLIGLAAVLLMAMNGRIAGVSGIFQGALDGTPGDRGWRWLFIGGLILGAWLSISLNGAGFSPRPDYPPVVLLLAGLAVGFGTRLGSGCTSGHGVCGIARLSWRSVVATLVFMFTGFISVYVIRHLAAVSW